MVPQSRQTGDEYTRRALGSMNNTLPLSFLAPDSSRQQVTRVRLYNHPNLPPRCKFKRIARA